MKWSRHFARYLIITLFSFGLGFIVAWLLQGYPIFRIGGNFVAGGLSLGVVIEVIGMIREWRREKKEEKAKKIVELEQYLKEHSKDLNGVLKKWFERESTNGAFSHETYYSTPLADAYYEPHGKSQIKGDSEPSLEYVDQVIDHLKHGYRDYWNMWTDCKNRVNNHLKNVVKTWETIEKKLVTNIPKEFVEWDGKRTSPATCYILRYTVGKIYKDAQHFQRFKKFDESLLKPVREKNYFKISTATFHAISPNESLSNKFSNIMCKIIADQDITELLESLDRENEGIKSDFEKFKGVLNTVVDDFEKGHINLKGTCSRCKPWHDELLSLG